MSFCDLRVAKHSKVQRFHRDINSQLKIMSLGVDSACDAQTIQKEQDHIIFVICACVFHITRSFYPSTRICPYIALLLLAVVTQVI